MPDKERERAPRQSERDEDELHGGAPRRGWWVGVREAFESGANAYLDALGFSEETDAEKPETLGEKLEAMRKDLAASLPRRWRLESFSVEKDEKRLRAVVMLPTTRVESVDALDGMLPDGWEIAGVVFDQREGELRVTLLFKAEPSSRRES